MSEADAIKSIEEALNQLDDDSARSRVLQWAVSKYAADGPVATPLPSHQPGPAATSQLAPLPTQAPGDLGGNEVPGVALLTDNGLKFTARDVKAKSALDAAVRIALVVVYLYKRFTNEDTVSSKKVLVPVLKEWRIHDANTRTVLRKHRGFIREGDRLSLDIHAEREAEQYIAEIQDGAIVGTWQPKSHSGRKSSSSKKKVKKTTIAKSKSR